MRYYSPSTRGFYSSDINANIPSDAVEVEEARYWELITQQASGLAIVPDEDGNPILSQPEVAVPLVVSMRQARLALLAAGMLSAVNAAIQSAGEQAQITWEYATDVRRDDAVLMQITAGLGLTEEQIDQLFIAASQM